MWLPFLSDPICIHYHWCVWSSARQWGIPPGKSPYPQKSYSIMRVANKWIHNCNTEKYKRGKGKCLGNPLGEALSSLKDNFLGEVLTNWRPEWCVVNQSRSIQRINNRGPIIGIPTQGLLLQCQWAKGIAHYLMAKYLTLHDSISFYIKWVTFKNMKYIEIALNISSCPCSELLGIHTHYNTIALIHTS